MAENTATEAPAKKGKLKLIIMLVIIIILAVGLSVVGTLWFLGGGLPGADDAETTTSAEPAFVVSSYTEIEKALVTTVQAQGRQRYAQVYVSFEAKDPAALAAADVHMPLIRSQLVMEFSNARRLSEAGSGFDVSGFVYSKATKDPTSGAFRRMYEPKTAKTWV